MAGTNFSDLVGLTISSVDVRRDVINEDDRIIFNMANGSIYTMYHSQDCCESVTIEDIDGDVNLLKNQEVLEATEESNSSDATGNSETWTYYKLRTNLESITIRWYGCSNGYYSERVSFEKLI